MCKSFAYTPVAEVYVKRERATVRIMRNPPVKLMKWSMEA